MPRRHWHANCHIPGYIPESDPMFTTKADAQDHMRWLRDDWRDMADIDGDTIAREDRIRFSGSIRSGLIVVSWGYHGCGRYIECYPCDHDCQEED